MQKKESNNSAYAWKILRANVTHNSSSSYPSRNSPTNLVCIKKKRKTVLVYIVYILTQSSFFYILKIWDALKSQFENHERQLARTCVLAVMGNAYTYNPTIYRGVNHRKPLEWGRVRGSKWNSPARACNTWIKIYGTSGSLFCTAALVLFFFF